ncbi:MAG: hypothetical protein ABFD64_01050 [Armatimonadota bacterium]
MKKAKVFLIPLIIILILGGLLVWDNMHKVTHGIPLDVLKMQDEYVKGPALIVRTEINYALISGLMTPPYIFITTYDGCGRKLKEDRNLKDYQDKYYYKYNRKGELIEETSYSPIDRDTIRTMIVYDPAKRRISSITRPDSYRNWLKRINRIFHHEHDLSSKSLTYLDSHNRPKIISGSVTGENTCIRYKYDSKGNMVCSTRAIKRGSRTYYIYKVYDNYGNPVKAKRYDGGRLVYTEVYTYKYDKCDNWIEKRVFEVSDTNGKQKKEEVQITRRTITYKN